MRKKPIWGSIETATDIDLQARVIALTNDYGFAIIANPNSEAPYTTD